MLPGLTHALLAFREQTVTSVMSFAQVQDDVRQSSSPEPDSARSRDRRGSGRMRSRTQERHRPGRRSHRSVMPPSHTDNTVLAA